MKNKKKSEKNAFQFLCHVSLKPKISLLAQKLWPSRKIQSSQKVKRQDQFVLIFPFHINLCSDIVYSIQEKIITDNLYQNKNTASKAVPYYRQNSFNINCPLFLKQKNRRKIDIGILKVNFQCLCACLSPRGLQTLFFFGPLMKNLIKKNNDQKNFDRSFCFHYLCLSACVSVSALQVTVFNVGS